MTLEEFYALPYNREHSVGRNVCGPSGIPLVIYDDREDRHREYDFDVRVGYDSKNPNYMNQYTVLDEFQLAVFLLDCTAPALETLPEE